MTQSRNSSRSLLAEKISQQVDRVAVQLGGKLDAADQFEAGCGGQRNRLIVALERVVIGDAESGHAGANGFADQVARANKCRQIR